MLSKHFELLRVNHFTYMYKCLSCYWKAQDGSEYEANRGTFLSHFP